MSTAQPRLPGSGVTVRVVRDDGATFVGVTIPSELYTPGYAAQRLAAVPGLTAPEQVRAANVAQIATHSPREPAQEGAGWAVYNAANGRVVYQLQADGSHLSQTIVPGYGLGQVVGGVSTPIALLMGSRFNQMGFGGFTGSDATDTNSNSRISSWNETGATVTKVRAYFANWAANGTSEQDGYNPITVTAALEYPAGTMTPLTFSGAASVTIAATGAGSLAESDEMTLPTPVPAGAQYWVRSYVSVAAGLKWVQGYSINTGNGEAADFSTGTDKTGGATITNAAQTSTRNGYGPVAVKATALTGTPIGKAFAALGDSLIMGSTDGLDASHGNIGYVAKAMSGSYPVINMGIAGTAAFNNLPANFTRRAALLAKIGVTHVFCDWSINDTSAGRTAAQQASDISAIAAGLKTAVPGLKVTWATQAPYTTGTFLTAAGQTIQSTPAGAFTGGSGSVRGQINALLRAGVSNVDYVFDAAASVEVNTANVLTQNGGYWISGNGGVGATSIHLSTNGTYSDNASADGLHPAGNYTIPPGYGGVYILRDAVRLVFGAW